MDIVVVTNPLSETFNFKFDSKSYSIEPFGSLTVTRDIAQHAAFRIAKKQFASTLNDADAVFFTDEKVAERAATYISNLEDKKPTTAKKVEKEEKIEDVLDKDF